MLWSSLYEVEATVEMVIQADEHVDELIVYFCTLYPEYYRH